MLVIPAIDLRGGQCVRLFQGCFDKETVYGKDPAAMARRWADAGAEWIHLVDLDASRTREPVNREAILAIRRAVPVSLEMGGGLRELDDMAFYFDHGLDRLILGTAALTEPDLVARAAERWPGRVAVGIDARGERVVVNAWAQETEVNYLDLARQLAGLGVAALIYTDVERDGTRKGPNLERTRALARQSEIPVIASGGVAGLGDLEALLPLEPDGVIGVITGRALYDGSLDYAAARTLAAGE